MDGDGEEVELAGMIAAPVFFECGETEVEASMPMSPDGGHHWGLLCGSTAAWGHIEVDEEVETTIELQATVDGATAHLLAPDGREVYELSPDRPSATLVLSPGMWTVAVIAMSPDDFGDFSLILTPTD
jgi:hypothetical protein